jgi:hypothetical protein
MRLFGESRTTGQFSCVHYKTLRGLPFGGRGVSISSSQIRPHVGHANFAIPRMNVSPSGLPGLPQRGQVGVSITVTSALSHARLCAQALILSVSDALILQR